MYFSSCIEIGPHLQNKVCFIVYKYLILVDTNPSLSHLQSIEDLS